MRELGRRAVGAFGRRGRTERGGPQRRPPQRGDRLAAQLGGVVVVAGRTIGVEVVGGDHLGDLLAVVGEGSPQVLGGGTVAGLALSPGQPFVGDRPQQPLAEAVLARLRGEWIGADREHLLTHQRPQRVVQLGLGEVAERRRRGPREAAPEYGHRPHEAALGRRECVEPGGDQRAQRRRHVELGELLDGHQAALALLQCSAAREHTQRLDRVQRHPLGAPDHRGAKARVQPVDERVQQLSHLGGRQRPEPHDRGAAPPRGPVLRCRLQLVACEREDEDRDSTEPSRAGAR